MIKRYIKTYRNLIGSFAAILMIIYGSFFLAYKHEQDHNQTILTNIQSSNLSYDMILHEKGVLLQHWLLFSSLIILICAGMAIYIIIENTESKNLAERASNEKSKVLAILSHELKTPLNSIIGFSDFIKNESFGPIEIREYVEFGQTINESGNHLLAVTNDILDATKIEFGKMTLHMELLDICRLLREVIRIHQPIATDKNLQLIYNEQCEIIIKADYRAVKQMIINLITNAIKYTEKGQITIATKITSNFLRIIISDTGIVIPKDKLKDIFEPFVQLDSKYERMKNGTGLGLSVVRGLAKLHGGRITVSSRLNIGSSFILHLPLPTKIDKL